MGAIKLTEACREDAARLYEFLSEHPAAEPSDLLLVLGCHDLRVAEHAAKLWLAGTAPLMICSGGYGKMTEGGPALSSTLGRTTLQVSPKLSER